MLKVRVYFCQRMRKRRKSYRQLFLRYRPAAKQLKAEIRQDPAEVQAAAVEAAPEAVSQRTMEIMTQR